MNLALNNIRRIENVQHCESLRKLDLTVNFIEDLLCVENLKENRELRELYLTGNPCTSQEGYRSFVIATLPQLQSLDSQAITKSERIQAEQDYPRIRERLVMQAEAMPQEDAAPVEVDTSPEFDLHETVPHTPETRLQTARELAKRRAQGRPEDAPPPRPKPVETPPVSFHEDGRIRQRNMPKVEFKMVDSPDEVVLNVKLSPFVDSSLLELKVERTWVRLVVKGRPLDVCLPAPVQHERAEAVRAQVTGELEVRMPKEQAGPLKKKQTSFTGYIAGSKPGTLRDETEGKSGTVDYRHIVKEPKGMVTAGHIKLSRQAGPSAEALARQQQALNEFEDDADVPPLE